MFTVGANGRLENGAGPARPEASGVHLIKGFFSEEEVGWVFEEIGYLAFDTATVGGKGENKSVRDAMTAWLPKESFAAERLVGAAKTVSDAPLGEWSMVQVSCYPPGGFYNWHQDAGPTYGHRLWSAVVELQSAPGGGLEIEGYGAVDLEPGDLCLFPSGLKHRATAPIEGQRFSLVMWFSGQP